MALGELVDLLLQLGASFADQPAHVAALVDRRLLVHAEVRENLAPEAGRVAIHHGDVDQSRIDHFQQVVVRQVLGGCLELDRRFALAGELRVELLEMTPVARGPSHHDMLAGEVVERAHRRRLRSRDRHLLDAAEERAAGVHLGETVGGEREDAGGYVAQAGQETGNERVARSGNEDHMNIYVPPGSVLLAEPVLERAEQLVLHAGLPAPIDPVLGTGGRDQDADHAPGDHAVEIAGPGVGERPDERRHLGGHGVGPRAGVGCRGIRHGGECAGVGGRRGVAGDRGAPGLGAGRTAASPCKSSGQKSTDAGS